LKRKKREAGMEDEDGEGSDDDAEEGPLTQASLDEDERAFLRQATALRTSLSSTAKDLPEFKWVPGKEEKLVEVIAHAKALQKPHDIVADVASKKPDYIRRKDATFVRIQTGIWNMVKLGVGSVEHVCSGGSSLDALEVLTLKACELFRKVNDVRKVEVLGISKTVIDAGDDSNAQRQLKLLQEQMQAGKDLQALQRRVSFGNSGSRRPGAAPASSPPSTPRTGGNYGRRNRRKGRGPGGGGGGKGPFFPRGPQSSSRSPNPGAGGSN
jgi:hypothetical protein